MKITTKSRYAIRAIYALYVLGGAEQPVGLGKIAEHEDISKKYLEQIFMRLKETGVVTGSRGAGGGYMFATDPSKTSLKEVVHAMDGPQIPYKCISEKTCKRYSYCAVNGLWNGLKKNVDNYLDSITIADLATDKRFGGHSGDLS